MKRGMFDGKALSCALCAGAMQTATAVGAILLGSPGVVNFDTGVIDFTRMNSRTIVTEIAAAGVLLGSYPLDWLIRQTEQYQWAPSSEPVILAHGFGGNRSNLLGLAAYLRLARFDNVTYFQYPRWQSIDDSAAQLGHLIEEKGGESGVHLIGHSLGGTIARRYTADAPAGAVRTLITLGSPYSYGQRSPREIGIFGDDDPIVPAPIEDMLHPAAFARIVVLRDIGHLALIFHPEVLRIIGTELRANRASETVHAAT